MRRIIRILALGLLSSLLVAMPAGAAKPTMERIDPTGTVVDPFLSEACGTEVSVTFSGHFILRSFTDAQGNPVREVNNYANTRTYSSENGSFTVKDVGADRVSYLDDGSIVVIIIGNVGSITVPGQGAVYLDVGRSRLVITFDTNGDPTFDFTPLGGQHDPGADIVICDILG